MSEVTERGMHISFTSKALADEFCKKMWDMVYKIDVITVNDILLLAKRPISPKWHNEGLKNGYTKKEIRKVKPVKTGNGYLVILPAPGRMVRDSNGYWTTDRG